MKQIGIFAKNTTCALAALVLLVAPNLQAQQDGSGKVRAIHGTAMASVNGGGWTQLNVNDTIKPGTFIRTDTDSTVDLFLENSVVRIAADSMMGLDRFSIDRTGVEKVYETQLNLKNGRVLGNVKKLAAASKYEIKTPTGVAGIRGTDFDISVTPLPGGRFRFVVTSISGTIVGSGINRQNIVVTAVINTGETWTPDDVVEKLPEHVWHDLQDQIARLIGIPDPTIPTPPEPPVIIDPVPSPFTL